MCPQVHSPFTFDETDFKFQGEKDRVLVWLTPKGDDLQLFHFAVPPDIEADPRDVESLRALLRPKVLREGHGVIEIEAGVVDSCVAARTLFKVAQEPLGRTYVGTLVFPFRDFSYVFRVESPEQGVTGFRESIILSKLLNTRVSLDVEAGQLRGWLDDPYDSNETGPMTRNVSERREYDSRFPNHPLSRARWVLDHLGRTLRIDDALKQQPRFGDSVSNKLPQPS